MEACIEGQPITVAVDVDRYPVDVLHDDVGQPVRSRAAVEQPCNVRMIERCENLPFDLRPLVDGGVDEMVADQLDCHALLELIVRALGEIDDGHAAGADTAHETILADALPGAVRRPASGVDFEVLEGPADDVGHGRVVVDRPVEQRSNVAAQLRVVGAGVVQKSLPLRLCHVGGRVEERLDARPARRRQINRLRVH